MKIIIISEKVPLFKYMFGGGGSDLSKMNYRSLPQGFSRIVGFFLGYHPWTSIWA